MQNKNQQINKVVASLPLLCAIHCAATPFLITSLPWLGLDLVGSEVFEWVVLGLSLLYAIYILQKDWRKHKKITAILVAVVGFMFVFSAHIWHQSTVLLSVVGGVAILFAYGINWQAIRQAKSCSV